MSSSSPGVDTISREAVVSAANLLLVSLLKLNRAFVPIILRWVRGRRTNWINRASDDVYTDLRAGTNTRSLCVRHCCAASYELEAEKSDEDSDGKFDDDDDSDDSEDWDRRQRQAQVGIPVLPTQTDGGSQQALAGSQVNNNDEIQPQVRIRVTPTPTAAPVDRESPQVPPIEISQTAPHESSSKKRSFFRSSKPNNVHPDGGFTVPIYARGLIRRSLGLGVQQTDEELEQYIRLLVAQEEKHRRQRVIPFVYQSVLTGWITVLSLILYSAAILIITGTYFPMEEGQFISFSFSLVATATVSEADKLMQVVRRRKPTGAETATTVTTSAVGPAAQRRKKKKHSRGVGDTTETHGGEHGTTGDDNIPENAPVPGSSLDAE